MPEYMWKCKHCGEIVTIKMPIEHRDVQPTKCPTCLSVELKRILAATPHIGEKGKGRWQHT